MSTDQLQTRFASLLDEHRKIVYKIASSYCASRDDRDDLAQDIVTQAWRSFGGFDERVRFSTWFYRVALNVAISFARRETRRARHVVLDDAILLESPEETQGEAEDLLLLRQFVETLDPLGKALILLYLDGYAYREIAEMLGITETNVATKISRLKAALRRYFAAGETA